jgi:hypothetical protein
MLWRKLPNRGRLSEEHAQGFRLVGDRPQDVGSPGMAQPGRPRCPWRGDQHGGRRHRLGSANQRLAYNVCDGTREVMNP